jgi:DUF4097 and DUF4098 domain-containing protein YvlB
MSIKVKIFFLVLLNLILATTLFSREVEETFKKNVPVDGAKRLSLENRNGSVEIRAWDKDEIGVTAFKKVNAEDEDEAVRILEMMEVIIEVSGDEIIITTDYPHSGNKKRGNGGFFSWLMGGSWGVSYSVSYEVFVPEKFDIDVKSTNGEISVIKCNGRIRLETTNGKIKANDVSGSLRCSTTNGSINASFIEVTETDEMNFTSTNGSISLYLPEDIGAEIKARTTNGSINCDMNVTEHYERSKKSLDVEVNDGGVLIYVKTTNGSINIYEG